jgi:putative hydrolase of the HAD superfamily
LLRLVVFDGDDTLWRTMPLYTAAKAEFGRVLSSRIGVPPRKAIETLEKLDRANVQRFGFSRRRFPRSMSDAYVALAAAGGWRVDPSFRKDVRLIGESVFLRRSPRIRDAERLLKVLNCVGLKLVLCSKGDARVQRNRIKESGLAHFFTKIYVFPEKGEDQFREVLCEQRVQPAEGCSVGNSVRSDINPALRIGMRAVWIRTETWAYEDEIPIRTRRLSVARNCQEIVRALGITRPQWNCRGRV